MKTTIIVLLLLAFSYWSVRPLFSQGWFSMHDDTQVGRVVAMGRAIRNGQFPVRWVADLGYGYGYPLFNFYGPLPYYIGGILYSVGVSGLIATKAMFVIGIIGAAISMFLFARTLIGDTGALVAAVAYLYAPYHAVQIYVRGAVGEFWVLMFLPLILLGLSKGNVVIGSIGLAGAILSHTILGYVTTLALVLGICVYFVVRRTELRSLLSIVLLGLGLSAFFWLPAIVEMGYTNVAGQIGKTAFWGDHFVCLGQLVYSDWGFGGSAPGCVDGLSFKLGKIHILLAIVGMLAAVKFRKRTIFGIIALTGVISVFFLTQWSSGLWQFIPNASFVQYPWRMLVYTIFAISVFAGASIAIVRVTWMRTSGALIIAFVIIAVNAKLFIPQYGYPREAAVFETDEELRLRVSAISDEYLPRGARRPTELSQVPKTTIKVPDGGSVETEIDTETYTKAMITVRKSEPVIINRAHFPGWRYYIEGREVNPVIAHGLPTIIFPQGTSLFESRFTDTPVRIVGNVGSIICVLLVISQLTRYEKKAHA